MRSHIRRSIIVILIISWCQAIFAHQQDSLQQCSTHSCCCKNDPTPAGIMISHIHPKKEWMIAYKYMQMGMTELMQGSQSISKEQVFTNYLMAPDHMRMDMHMLMGMYGLTHKLTMMGMLNYNTASMEMGMFTTGGHHHAGSEGASGGHLMETSGLGDIKLYALYSPLNKGRHQFLLSAGISIPTGSIAQKGNNGDMLYPGMRLPYAMQLGSGTYDVLPCINYLYQPGKFAISAQVSGTVRTGNNANGYRLGNEITANTWFAYQWLKCLSSSLRIEGSQSGAVSGSDKQLYRYNEPSANAANYGGKRVTCYVGSVFRLKKGLLNTTSLGVEYGMPVYQDWNGIQMKLQHSVNASVSVGF